MFCVLGSLNVLWKGYSTVFWECRVYRMALLTELKGAALVLLEVLFGGADPEALPEALNRCTAFNSEALRGAGVVANFKSRAGLTPGTQSVAPHHLRSWGDTFAQYSA